MCIGIFAGISLSVLFLRGKRLAALQYRKLVARIGMVRGGLRGAATGWTSG